MYKVIIYLLINIFDDYWVSVINRDEEIKLARIYFSFICRAANPFWVTLFPSNNLGLI